MIDQSPGTTDLSMSTRSSPGIVGVLEIYLPNGWCGGAWERKAVRLSKGVF
jgi:hypothetical protein